MPATTYSRLENSRTMFSRPDQFLERATLGSSAFFGACRTLISIVILSESIPNGVGHTSNVHFAYFIVSIPLSAITTAALASSLFRATRSPARMQLSHTDVNSRCNQAALVCLVSLAIAFFDFTAFDQDIANLSGATARGRCFNLIASTWMACICTAYCWLVHQSSPIPDEDATDSL